MKYFLISIILFALSCANAKKYEKTKSEINSLDQKNISCHQEEVKLLKKLHKESIELSKNGNNKEAELKNTQAKVLLEEIKKPCPDKNENNLIKEKNNDNFNPQSTEIYSNVSEDLKLTLVGNYKPEMIHFEFNSYKISEEAKKILLKHTNYLSDKKNIEVQIEGNTDSRGSEEYNLNLGSKRAKVVENFFKNQGINLNIKTVSFGEELLLDEGNNEEAHKKNRRVEFKFLIKGK